MPLSAKDFYYYETFKADMDEALLLAGGCNAQLSELALEALRKKTYRKVDDAWGLFSEETKDSYLKKAQKSPKNSDQLVSPPNRIVRYLKGLDVAARIAREKKVKEFSKKVNK